METALLGVKETSASAVSETYIFYASDRTLKEH